MRNGRFDIRIDYDFRTVMEACAATAPDRESTWISPEMIDTYTTLHKLGFAHSVEVWRDEWMIGGLYGVAIRGLFAGESMFSRERDASKVALAHLVERLRRGGFVLLDTQFVVGSHMLQFGTIEIPTAEYKVRLAQALLVETVF